MEVILILVGAVILVQQETFPVPIPGFYGEPQSSETIKWGFFRFPHTNATSISNEDQIFEEGR